MATLQSTLSNTALPLVLTVSQQGVGGVAGLAPTVAVRLGSTTNMYLDWTTGVFMAAGWVVRDQPLTDIGGGTYQALLDMTTLVGVVVGDTLVAEYTVPDPVVARAADHDSIEVVADLDGPRISFSATATGAAPAQTVEALASLVRGGIQVTAGLVGAICTMRDPTGVVIFGPVAMTAQPNGYFSAAVAGLSLVDNENYNFECSITDASGTVTEFIITPTTGP